jgi:hypothetical protein
LHAFSKTAAEDAAHDQQKWPLPRALRHFVPSRVPPPRSRDLLRRASSPRLASSPASASSSARRAPPRYCFLLPPRWRDERSQHALAKVELCSRESNAVLASSATNIWEDALHLLSLRLLRVPACVKIHKSARASPCTVAYKDSVVTKQRYGISEIGESYLPRGTQCVQSDYRVWTIIAADAGGEATCPK